MKNIYDIISEQKVITDINIADYDLTATINTYNEYIQEGFGESLKKAAKKVVEFIKKMIAKIKELVSKVLSYFRKSETKTVDSMNADIAEANKKYDEKVAEKEEPKPEPPKEEPPKVEKPEGPKAPKVDVVKKNIEKYDNKPKEEPKQPPKNPKFVEKKVTINDILATSTFTCRAIRYGSITNRFGFFAKLIPIHDRIYSNIVRGVRNGEEGVTYKNYQSELFTQLFGSNWSENNLFENLDIAFDDQLDDTPREISVREYRGIILDYVNGADNFKDRVTKAEKEIIGKMNDLIKKINSNEIKPDENASEHQINEMRLLAHSVTLNLGEIFRYLITTTAKAHKQYSEIADKAKEHYCNMLLGSV